MNSKKKVVIAMSGGIDSSVAAALLKDVSGVFMKLFSTSSRGSEERAKEVAQILKIPFSVLNFEKEFKKKVIDDFLAAYKKGLTPNPCVVCNKEIKFGLLLEKALALGADYIATGHYAKKQKIENRKQKIEYKLLKAKDREKDQSYFLWQLNQNQLKHILFPVGGYTKEEVKKLAKKFKLPVLKIKESQEICFVSKTINGFLNRHLKPKPGKIIWATPDVAQPKIVGEHQGLIFYTIGQRKGLGLSGGPWYVLDKDFKKNLLIVTQNQKDLYKKELICEKVNWISGKPPKLPLKVKAKIRYRHQPASAKIIKPETWNRKHKKYKIVFSRAQRAITPGQSVVFYSGQELLGGGIISL